MFIFSLPEKPLNFKSMDSYISFPLLQGNYDFKISFEIKPELRNALVLYMNGKSNQDHFAIAIINGILQLRLVIWKKRLANCNWFSWEKEWPFANPNLWSSNNWQFSLSLFLLQFRMNAGGGQVIARFNQPLPLSTWHKIDVKRNDRAVTMTLNNVLETTGVLSPGFTVLDFQGQMFIGSPSTPVGRWDFKNILLK